MQLVTHQTGPEGQLVRKVLIEETADIAQELYVSITLDRAQGKPVIMASSQGGMDIEEVAEKDPEAIFRSRRRAGARPPAVPGPRRRPRPRPQGGDGVQGREADHRPGQRLHGHRRLARRDQPADGHRRRRRHGARRQDEFRRQRPLPPQGHRRHARPRRGEPPGGRGQQVQPQLHQARRQHRLHGQRRRARHGDDGHHQALRRRAGQLPRRRRRRLAGGGQERLPHPGLGPQRQGRPDQHLRRHRPHATASPAAWSGRSRSSADVKIPVVVRLEGTNVDEGRRDPARGAVPVHRGRADGRRRREGRGRAAKGGA